MTKAPRGMEEASREYKLEDTALQIRKIGNSVGVILPKSLQRLNLKEGGSSIVELPAAVSALPSIPTTRGPWKWPS